MHTPCMHSLRSTLSCTLAPHTLTTNRAHTHTHRCCTVPTTTCYGYSGTSTCTWSTCLTPVRSAFPVSQLVASLVAHCCGAPRALPRRGPSCPPPHPGAQALRCCYSTSKHALGGPLLLPGALFPGAGIRCTHVPVVSPRQGVSAARPSFPQGVPQGGCDAPDFCPKICSRHRSTGRAGYKGALLSFQ